MPFKCTQSQSFIRKWLGAPISLPQTLNLILSPAVAFSSKMSSLERGKLKTWSLIIWRKTPRSARHWASSDAHPLKYLKPLRWSWKLCFFHDCFRDFNSSILYWCHISYNLYVCFSSRRGWSFLATAGPVICDTALWSPPHLQDDWSSKPAL